ncbi:MAG TPA: glucose-6-phosphate dehydrogenase [Candidatus Saccharimonadales bacterium]|nr:glucose-6-phosphate dehydrogenase [Candidatus Saccharimonadales bacterium]
MNSPFIFVIFGATGDLAQHKLIPALFKLYKQGELGKDFFIVGFARREFSDQQYAHMLGDELETHKDPKWAKFAKNIHYQKGIFEDPAGYEELIEKLNVFDKKIGACITRFFYLATPPDNYLSILENLKTSKLSDGCGPAFNKLSGSLQESVGKWVRIAIEKPFGRDLETAKELDRKLSDIFAEEQIYRVDHYLGKETVQNMIAFRFANNIFEPVWNNKHIDHVQITFAQDEGIEKRGKFFDGVGILRDIAQNHLLQLLATVAMEQPKSFSKEGVRDARAAAIKSIRQITPSNIAKFVVRGQYKGYKDEKDVKEGSTTETFTALKLFVDTPRFEGVPFYIRAGKKMPKEVIKISIVFIQTCHLLFKEYGCPEIGNVLTIRIQPDEGIKMRVIAKSPGSKVVLSPVDMSFSYHQSFGNYGIDAYEKLLLDIFHGDQMLFNRSDELESTWKLISNILKGWEKEKLKIPVYKPGTWGPEEGQELIENDGRKWL